MIAELSREFSAKPSYDVCVIGAGAAGITVAAKARALGLSVFLAEAGGEEYSDVSQGCYRGSVVGDEYFDLEHARLRYFGGTTNHWGGMCRPLEAYDFDAKSAAGGTGWPIAQKHLDAYRAEASEVLEIPAVPEDTVLNPEKTLRRIHFVFSPPVRFAEKFQPVFAGDDGIDVCLNCNAVGVVYDGRIVRGVSFRNFENHEIVVAAKTYVLACGGIENSRLLLHWNASYNDALGNAKGAVGRYWMEHLTQTIGGLLTCGNISFRDDNVYRPISTERLYLAPTREFAESRNILNCGVHIYRIPHGAIGRIVSSAVCSVPDWLAETLGRGVASGLSVHWVRASSEQEPVPENRVVLGSEKDRFGIPQPVVHWKRSALDKRTLRTVALESGAFFARADLGRLRLHDWLLADDVRFACQDGGNCPGGYHHMGGTRMAASPDHGVVDGNCRVFGSENLFVAGSSVFPSGGYCNPTMSIVQLSLRLATHLRAIAA